MKGRQPGRSSLATSRYVQLSEILIKDIAGGRYPIDSKLPTEHELCRQYNYSRHTVREALRRLKELGLVSRRQGSGTTVRALQPSGSYVQTIQSLDDIVQLAQEARLSILSSETIASDQWLSRQLDCEWGKGWLRIEGLRIVEGRSAPITWTEIYIDDRYGGVRRLIKNAPRAISALIQENYDEPIAEVRQYISAVAAPKHIAKLMKIAPGSPALSIVRKYRTGAGEVILMSVSIHPGERYTYSMKINKL
jgi:DNA-binding GntR family transcriptional regulator